MTDSRLKEAYLIVARKVTAELNRYPDELINMLEVVNGQIKIKGDSGQEPQKEVEAMTKAELIASVAGDVKFKKLV